MAEPVLLLIVSDALPAAAFSTTGVPTVVGSVLKPPDFPADEQLCHLPDRRDVARTVLYDAGHTGVQLLSADTMPIDQLKIVCECVNRLEA